MRLTPCTRPVVLLAFSTVWAQNLAPQDQTKAPDADTIHINVNLVQVDALVTDSKHHLVTDLKASDFQIVQDGKPQKITNFSYVNLMPGDSDAAHATPTAPKTKGAPPPPPNMVRPERARRMLALVVDDLGLSFDSVGRVRGALKKFVDEQMQPGDLVSIMLTGRGMGALEQFTADKRILYAAIDHVRFNSLGRVSVNGGMSRGREEEGINAAGSLGAIRYVVNGLRELPGRKAVVLFSQNMKLFSRGGENDRVLQGVRELEDAANRASVVIYSIDPRGLETLQLDASDNTTRMSPRQLARVPQAKAREQFDSREGLFALANDTGGRFYADTNDIGGALHDAVADTEGYYLLGYHPDASTFDVNGRPKFHNVKVKVLRAGLDVRSRSGFFGRSDLLHPVKPQGPAAQMRAALTSPFGASGVHMRLTAVYAQAPTGSVIDAMVHIDAKDLHFTDQPDGWHQAVFDIAAVTFDPNGQAIDSTSKTFTARLKDAALQNALANGLIYNVPHPVKKPGSYQLRIALRDDDAAGAVGSASEFVEVPDLSKGKLTLSSLVLRKYLPQQSAPAPAQAPADAGAAKAGNQTAAANSAQSLSSPAIRTFKPGDEIVYGYQILNAHQESNQKADIETYARVYRDGKEIFTSPPRPMEDSAPAGGKELVSGGILKLGAQMKPGDYVVQVVVNEKGGKSTATQSTDFEVESGVASQPRQ
jgi:VWFA-related protein